MNRNRYRLVFSATAGMMVPLAETARGRGKAASSSVLSGVLLAGVVLSTAAQAELPVARAGAAFMSAGQAAYQVNGNQAFVNQVGNKSILNWQSFNVSAGNSVQFRQVDSLATNNLVQGASFTSLNRIWDANPSVIAGSLSQGAGQQANVIMVNTNGIAFMGGAQVNLNSFTASSLNIADNFVMNRLLGDNSTPQFTGTGGFVKVFEGARITAGSQGRVMLIAPTVVNKGVVEAPDGQVILAAGTKVYLRSADDENLNVRGLLVEVDSPADINAANTSVPANLFDASTDKLGHATNLGELSTPRGNVTMVGYAVNQLGIARATTSVVANGSVYLMAKDTSVDVNASRGSSRGGNVLLGENSLTQVLPETDDLTTTVDGDTGAGLAKASEVRVLGKTVTMARGATIDAPAGKVDLIAVSDPSELSLRTSSLDKDEARPNDGARVYIASGARINVAGLSGVEVSAARNAVEVELRGDELKDSPVNQQGPLRGQTAYVDVARALAHAAAGESTLIAQDSLESYQGRLERTVAERSTAGGTVTIRSEGETILDSGAVIDLSGGSVVYTPANVKTTLLIANGKLVDLSDANAETRYDGIATRFVIDYGRWNQKEVIDLGQSFRFDPGYTEGKNAGALNITSMGTAFIQADIQGRTTVGELQRANATAPAGATLTLGRSVAGDGLQDYKFNQKVVLDRVAASLPADFGIGDALSDDLKGTLVLNAALLAKDKVANLNVFTNQAAEVRTALRAPQGGSVTIVAKDLLVKADIEASGGVIDLAARNNVFSTVNDPMLRVDDGVQLSARGAWVNDRFGVAEGDGSLPLINGGTISLLADARLTSDGTGDTHGTVSLGQGVTIDASGGARLSAAGKVTAGKGGTISLSGFAVEGLDANVTAYGLEKGGSLNVTSNRILIGGNPENGVGTLNLDAGFFTRGGFADFALTGLSSLEVAQDTTVRPQVVNRELLASYAAAPTGAALADFSQLIVLDDHLRDAANISLAAKQSGAGTGELLIGQGAHIEVEPKGKIALEARNTLDIEGVLVAHGGAISAVLDRSSGFVGSALNQNALWLGQGAVLDVSGTAMTYTDDRGLTQGEVLAGGTVSLNAKTGYVIAEAGSRINVAGAAPVELDVFNETGALKRMIGSDAGVLSVYAEEGILLDATLDAHPGGASNRGGELTIELSKNARQEGQVGYDSQARALSLASSVSPQTAGMSPDAPIPVTGVVRARIGTDKLEAAGFDSMHFSSRDAIILEDGLNLGAAGVLPLRELKLDAARIETLGGNVALHADALLLGNYDTNNRVGSDPASFSTTGTLLADARLLELAGNLRLRGMALTDLTGTETVRLAGVTRDKLDATGASTSSYEYSTNIDTTADLTIKGAVIAPSSYAQVSLSAPGKTISFESVGVEPEQPLSALGSVQVDAADIVQAGRLWAPLGSIALNASNMLTLRSGSLTSVAATPGSLLSLGQVQNGLDWVVNVNSSEVPKGQIKIDSMPEKSVRLSGAAVDLQAGAKVNIAGGGDLQAYEFTVGPGGSHDILADANTYAILPGYQGGFAPTDPQEAMKLASGSAVYLSGVPGLADGVYTLLPAHYALLPGAYAIKLNTGIKDLMPGQTYSRQDGVRIAAGYVTDTRANAPKDANWSGIEVLTRDQVLARSELTLSPASTFFSGGNNLPQDAGLLSVATQGLLNLDATFLTSPAAGGRGAAVDVSAPILALTSGNPAGIDAAATRIDVAKLNALGADSLLLGATRERLGTTTTLTVGANSVILANDEANPLTGAEIILAANNDLTLKSGSVIDAQGNAGDAGQYMSAGNGALLRAASTTATFERSGSPDRSQGTLVGETGSLVRAADSISLDATQVNAFEGIAEFKKNGVAVAGNLAVGATRVNFGAAPTGSEGITYNQTDLDSLNDLKGLTLTSYSTFDLYGDVSVGGLDANGKPKMQNLSLLGAGLAGLNNSGKTANLRAQNIKLSNPAAVAFVPGGSSLGDGALAIQADTLTLGNGDKSVKGFSAVDITANELVGAGQGSSTFVAPTTIHVARIRGETNADQTLTASGVLTVADHTADRALAVVNALGAKWAMAGSSVDFDTHVELPSGQFKLTATAGDLELGASARVDLAGRTVDFFDVSRSTWGGTAEFTSDTGNVSFFSGANVDVSGAAGADAGTLKVTATKGTVTLADGSVTGKATAAADGARGEGARVQIDTGTLASFSAINATLNTGGFDGERTLRVRSGDVTVAGSDNVKAQNINLAADSGKIDVAGKLDASGESAGRIELFAKGDVNLKAGAVLDAISTGAGQDGGNVVIGTRDGILDLAAGSAINVAAGSSGVGGKVLLRAPRTGAGAGTEVAVSALQSTVTGASSLAVEAVKPYDGITTLTATGTSSGSTLSLATINTNNTTFATAFNTIKNRLGMTENPLFHLLSGVEVRSTGDLTLGTGTTATDWNLKSSRAGGEAGVLTLRAAGNLSIKSNLSDGFSDATAYSSGTTPATLVAGDSWSYRLIAGADSAAADPMAVSAAKDFTLAAGKLIRTGTGDIQVASGRDITLADASSVIYTAGRAADGVLSFTKPIDGQSAYFSQGGGDVSLDAVRDVVGKASSQLYSAWLFRQGQLNNDGTAYVQGSPAWWVRFDQFKEGVGALGGGDVTIRAGGMVSNLSASAPTQGRLASTTPNASATLVKTGGGTVRVEAGKDVLGGQYYADNGDVVVNAGGQVGTGQSLFGKPVYTILALGDGQARVRAQDDVNIHAILTPQLMAQTKCGSGASSTCNLDSSDASGKRRSYFSTYTDASGASLASLDGNVTLHSPSGSNAVAALTTLYSISSSDLMAYLPPSLGMTAFQGDVVIHDQPAGGRMTMQPSAHGELDLLAQGSVKINGSITMSDRDPALVPSPALPVTNPTSITSNDSRVSPLHAATPVHTGDVNLVHIYAKEGDVLGVSQAFGDGQKGTQVTVPKSIAVRAGRDVTDLSIQAQNLESSDRSVIEAGRDVKFSAGSIRTDNDGIVIGGPGRLEVTAGRNVDLGTSGGIVSRGDLDNSNLPLGGADIQVLAGVGANGLDVAGAINRLIDKLDAGATDESTLWLARWLTGNDQLNASNALAAVRDVQAQGSDAQRSSVRAMVFAALRQTGRDANQTDSGYAGDFSRGYAALDLVFPGIGDKNPDGSFKNYQGNINIFASRIKTERGGNIEFMIPGGELVVGLANTPKALVENVPALGIVAAAQGDIKGFARDDMLVNQSRILTVAGGDVMLWSSEGDIDAGKGKKTATSVPAPIIKTDSQGNVTQELQGATSGSGIGALSSGDVVAGDVDLIAPKGTVNAGDAGIRAGNLNIAAQLVLGADNISVSGKSTGTPVVDASFVTASASGATAGGDDVSKAVAALSQSAADAAKNAQALSDAFKPSFVRVEVVGFGE